MAALRSAFEERLGEVNAYLDFLAAMEMRAQAGAPRFEGSDQVVSPQQQKLLYANVYLYLYSLVEATMTLCIESVSRAACDDGGCVVGDLTLELRREWVRSAGRTHVDMAPVSRLEAAVDMIDHVLSALPLDDFSIERGGGGNWDDTAIEKMSDRLGVRLAVSAPVRRAVKQHVRDDRGSLGLVKWMRNSLAHGSMSFEESGSQVSFEDLKRVATSVVRYLSEVVSRFERYVEQREFLAPDRRPSA